MSKFVYSFIQVKKHDECSILSFNIFIVCARNLHNNLHFPFFYNWSMLHVVLVFIYLPNSVGMIQDMDMDFNLKYCIL